MRDPYKMFNKLIEKNEKFRELVERAKQMDNDEIMKLPLPLWQRNILSEMRIKKLLKKSIDDFNIKEIKPWEDIVIEVRRVTNELWVKQPKKENLFEPEHIIGITGDNIFWGFTYLTGCLNVSEVVQNSALISEMSKDEYLEYYRNTVSNKNAVVDHDDRIGNTGTNMLDAYGVRFK